MAEYIKKEDILKVIAEAYEETIQYSSATTFGIAILNGFTKLQSYVNLNSADVEERKTGYDTKASRYFHCSVCDYGVSDVYEDGPVRCFDKNREWSNCPNCGARMVKDG